MKWMLGFFLLTSCGFHFGKGSIAEKYHTVTVPYAENDYYGRLTNELAKEFSKQGGLEYRRKKGELTLKVNIVDITHKHIGFRYDRDDKDRPNERLLPNEGRVTAYAEITLVETVSGKTVLGPAIVRATADYDHDYYTTPDRAFRFSLGQLDDIDVAEEQAMAPLNRALAKRIVDFVTQSW